MLWALPIAATLLALSTGSALWATGTVTQAMAAHGALMLTAWGLLMPAGGIVARYYKVMPGQDFPRIADNLTWWRWHQGLQYSGMGAATLALVIILSETGGHLDTLHGRLGIVVMALGGLQVASGWMRGSRGGPTARSADPGEPSTWRGDHYDMTSRRLAFERWHKPVGWASLVLAGTTVLLGTILVGSPSWLVAVVGALQAAAGIGLADGRLRRRWVDTYAALWGDDPRHPGNRRGGGEAKRGDMVPPRGDDVSHASSTNPVPRARGRG